MALVVETGAGVTGANTYASVADARAYATAGGDSLPTDDASVEALLVRAMRYLEAQRARYRGTRTFPAGLQWPRTDASVDGTALDPNAIPRELVDAQCQLAIDLQSADPSKVSSGPAVKQKTVGPLTTVYAIADGDVAPVRLPKVDALLAPLLKAGGGFTVERA